MRAQPSARRCAPAQPPTSPAPRSVHIPTQKRLARQSTCKCGPAQHFKLGRGANGVITFALPDPACPSCCTARTARSSATAPSRSPRSASSGAYNPPGWLRNPGLEWLRRPVHPPGSSNAPGSSELPAPTGGSPRGLRPALPRRGAPAAFRTELSANECCAPMSQVGGSRWRRRRRRLPALLLLRVPLPAAATARARRWEQVHCRFSVSSLRKRPVKTHGAWIKSRSSIRIAHRSASSDARLYEVSSVSGCCAIATALHAAVRAWKTTKE